MNLVVGESVEIHDPVPPVAIRFRYENRCPHVGVLELIRDNRVVQYAAAAGIVSLALARGSFGYRLRCLKEEGELSKVVSRGKINVFADRATRKLGARAPVTKLQTDGRSYTVLYQNRLPEVEVSWPSAPDGDSYQLVHSFDRKETTMALESASYGFASGKLKEGKHVFYFEAGGKLSRRSTVTIAFDNASPAARLTTPATMSMLPGEKVRIAGIALPGSKVSVGEKRVGVGSQGRFSVAAAVPSDLRAIAVNIRHPRLGNHIYLRRVVTR